MEYAARLAEAQQDSRSLTYAATALGHLTRGLRHDLNGRTLNVRAAPLIKDQEDLVEDWTKLPPEVQQQLDARLDAVKARMLAEPST